MASTPALLISLSLSIGAALLGTGIALAQDAAQDAPAQKGPNAVSYDRSIWIDLLRANHTLLRTVTHTEDGIEAVTEATDPEIVAKLIDHAEAMKVRIDTGAQVRIWDEVFVDLFENHKGINLEVTVTDRGVKIKESSTDPKIVAIMRSHAMGVSDFVREGTEASGKQTRRFSDGDPIPAPELAVGGVVHHIVLSHPNAEQLKALKDSGVDTVINLRKHSETPEYDEAAAAAEAGLEYINHPYNGAGELTPDLIAAVRKTLREQTAAGKRVAIHCRTGNRVAPIWMAFRVIDHGIDLDRAMAEAEAMHLTTPEYKVISLDYIAANWPDIGE